MQALALKYRPKNFDELIGQESTSKSLSHALDVKRLSHAYLFSGLRGSGKTSTARIFAKALLCENGPTSRPCEVCNNCIMANEGRHMDIIEMDAASHRKIDDIRELIEQTKYSPTSARFKIFIIDEVHMLTKEASNALLKTLEEPPEYVKFILATTDPLKLPVTVLSRTQHFRFHSILPNLVVAHLEKILQNEQISYEKGALEILARSGSGSLRDTLTLLDQAIIFSSENITQSLVAELLGLLDPAKIDEILEIITRQDRTALIEIIKEVQNYAPETIIDELIANIKEKFLNGDPKFSTLIYERFFRILSQSKSMLSISSDNGFVLAMSFFMMMEAVNLREIDELIESSKSLVRSQESQNLTPNNKLSQTQNEKPQNLSFHTPKIPQNQQISQPKPQILETPKTPFEIFVAKIYDRDYELGKIFENLIEFVSFENGIMKIISNATELKDRNALNSGFKAIKEILKECFGENAKLEVVKKNENLKQSVAENFQNGVENLLNFQTEQKMENKKEKSLEIISNLKDENSLISSEEASIRELDRLFGTHKI